MSFPRHRHGLAAIEMLAVVAVLAAVAAIVTIGAHDARRRSRLAGSIENLRTYAAGTQSYAADNDDKFWTYSWRAGTQNTEYADLNSASTDSQAAANQAVYIIRKFGESPNMPPINGWIPHILYSHLPLWEHMGLRMPARAHIAPEDRALLNLQRSAALPSSAARPAYASSYELGVPFWSPDAGPQGVVYQSGFHYIWTLAGNVNMGRRTLHEVRFPANKAHVWDTYQRDLGHRVLFFAMPDARVPVLTVDGSAGLRSSAFTNPGFRPQQPTSPEPTTFTYAPSTQEPPAQHPSGQDSVIGRMRWTRWGLRGRDFNGPEATGP